MLAKTSLDQHPFLVDLSRLTCIFAIFFNTSPTFFRASLVRGRLLELGELYGFVCVFFRGVFLHSRVTGACPVTTDLIM